MVCLVHSCCNRRFAHPHYCPKKNPYTLIMIDKDPGQNHVAVSPNVRVPWFEHTTKMENHPIAML